MCEIEASIHHVEVFAWITLSLPQHQILLVVLIISFFRLFSLVLDLQYICYLLSVYHLLKKIKR